MGIGVQFFSRKPEISGFREMYTYFYGFTEMQVRELIDQARQRSGQTLGQLAAELGVRQARISEWKAGVFRPDSSEIAFFADKAGLSVFQALAEIESELHPEMAHLWQKAVSEMWKNQG